jgi:predicted aldo/keto reductase-like oxidoreductase
LLSRRKVLGLGLAIGAMTPGSKHPVAKNQDAKPDKIVGYRTLGSTGLTISDISFGSSRSSDPDLIRYAFDRGITFYDTAESYRLGASETAIGVGLRGVRKDVVLASKTKASSNARWHEIMGSLEGSLRRLETDYLDIYYNHAVNDIARVRNDEWYEFCSRAKQKGKIRFSGMSGHGKRLVSCLEHVIEEGAVDVILTAYNFGQDPSFLSRLKQSLHFSYVQPGLRPILEKAHNKGIGVVAMKTLMGARRSDMKPYERGGDTFSQSAFRWVLSNAHVHSLIVSMTSREEIDEYIGASGSRDVTEAEIGLLKIYMERNGQKFCQPGCNQCMHSCPYGVEISEVLRTRMYLVDYKDPELARTDYAGLENNSGLCGTCTGDPCRNACPVRIPIQDWLKEAAQALG